MFSNLLNFIFETLLKIMNFSDVILTICFFVTVFVLAKNTKFYISMLLLKRRLELIRETILIEKELENDVSSYEKTIVVMYNSFSHSIFELWLLLLYLKSVNLIMIFKSILYVLKNICLEFVTEKFFILRNKNILIFLKKNILIFLRKYINETKNK